MEQPAAEGLPDAVDAPTLAEVSECIDVMYREHGHAVAAICRAILRDPWEAEDAAQQVFLSAQRAVLHGTLPRSPRAWLIVIARRECWARAQARRSVPFAPPDEGHERAVAAHDQLDAEELEAVWHGIAQLPARQREVLLLREIRGLSYDQLAERLALSRGSVRSLLTRARSGVRASVRGGSTAVGGTGWLEWLVRLFAESPAPAAKLAAVGLGSAAIAVGGMTARQLPAQHRHASAATPPAEAAVSPEAARARVVVPRRVAAVTRSVRVTPRRGVHPHQAPSSPAPRNGSPIEFRPPAPPPPDEPDSTPPTSQGAPAPASDRVGVGGTEVREGHRGRDGETRPVDGSSSGPRGPITPTSGSSGEGSGRVDDSASAPPATVTESAGAALSDSSGSHDEHGSGSDSGSGPSTSGESGAPSGSSTSDDGERSGGSHGGSDGH